MAINKIKIVMLFGFSLDENIYTGSKIYEDKLTYHLSHRKDIELHILTVGRNNGQIEKDRLIIHTVKKRKIFYIPFLTPILLWNVGRTLIKINPEVVHAISTGSFYSTEAAFFRNKYPTVLTAYGISLKEKKYYKQDYMKFLQLIFALIGILNERYVLSKIPNIVVDSSSIKDLINKWTKSKIYVVPAGIEYVKIEKMWSHTLLKENPDIFFVNNFTKIKGVDILIEALPLVKKSIPNLSVYIAGSGPQENSLKSLVEKFNLENNVKFLGFVSEEDKYRYYKACKLVVVPSRWDCQPLGLFEAAASGKPVIASDMSNPGIVEDRVTGFIFESENVEDLADKIITLLKNDRLREEMGNIAQQKVKQYDWSMVAEKYVEIYRGAIKDFQKKTRYKIL